MAHSNGTNTNPAAENWGITDQVTQLRILGSDIVYPLSELEGEHTLGASTECAIKIDDPSKQVSRLHARLMRTHETWLVLDLSSKNGIHIDGVQQPAGVLAPGTELGIGGVVLVAESVQLSALRGFLACLLGWGDDRRVQVDPAMRAVRAAATRLVPLVLSGRGELVSIAASLHAHAIGRDKPFIVCDRRRREVDADVRSAANIGNPSQAVRAAIGGSLCLLRHRMPSDMSAINEEFARPNPRVQLVLCTPSARSAGSAIRSFPAGRDGSSRFVPPKTFRPRLRALEWRRFRCHDGSHGAITWTRFGRRGSSRGNLPKAQDHGAVVARPQPARTEPGRWTDPWRSNLASLRQQLADGVTYGG